MNTREEDISLKELVRKLIKGLLYLWSKWLFILIVGLLGALIGLWYAWNSKPSYNASVSFVLSGDNQSASGLSGLVSQFGFDFRSGGTDVFSGENIITLMTSRNLVQQALLLKPPGEKKSLLNLITEEIGLDKAWANNKRTQNSFPFPDSATQMSLIQDSLFRDVYERVQKDYLKVEKLKNNQSIYKVSTSSANELIAVYLTKFLVDATSSFYIETKTKLARQNLSMLQHEADSLRMLLGGTISSTAEDIDKSFNLNPAYQIERSGIQQNQIRTTILSTAYGEVVKNIVIAKIGVQKETPLYQIIDEPVLPLKMHKTGKLKTLVLGGIMGAFAAVLMLISKRLFDSLLKNP